MEILINQRFSFAKIELLKNYCKIADKKKYLRETSPFDDTEITSFDMQLSSKRNKTVLFYSVPEDLSNYKRGICDFENVGVFYTNKDEKIKKYYNNPFADIQVVVLERSIIKRDGKIVVTETNYIKRREFNHRYFRKSTNKTKFTFDFNTGNFQVITYGVKSKTKTFRTNSFNSLKNFLEDKSKFDPDHWKRLKPWSQNKSFYSLSKVFKQTLNDREYYKTLGSIFGLTPNESDVKHRKNLYKKIMELFIKHRKIGAPDHSYEHFLEHHYPKEKYFKKNDRKLIAAVLDKYGIKSKIMVKLFHKHPFLDIHSMRKLCILLGDNYTKYIGSIPDEVFAMSQNHSHQFYGYETNDFLEKVAAFGIRDIEKENIVRVLSDVKNFTVINDMLIGEFADHFNMIREIRVYDENVMFKARTHVEFHTEHLELSKLFRAIRKGWSTQYFYEDKTIFEIEAPIQPNLIGQTSTFFPYILKREEEYVEEGAFMHHCVASYADHDKSMIVSIRNQDASDRITCEFNIQSGKLVQARHFCNKQVPDEFLEALTILQDKIRLHARFGTLNWKEKKKVPLMINGKEVINEENKRAAYTLPY